MIKRFIKEETGATAVEYAMIVGLIALVSFTAFTKLGEQVQRIIKEMFKSLSTVSDHNVS